MPASAGRGGALAQFPSEPVATLPCQAQVVTVNGTNYYQCSQTYYVQAYGASGPIYMPVQPPQ